MATLILYNDIYINLIVKNWSTDLIKTGLRIDDVVYTSIYTAVEAKMVELGLLGQKLNTTSAKGMLHQVFTGLNKQFQAVLVDIPQP